jgi:hypothetical protein
MQDYVYPSVYFAYFFFALMAALAVVFFVKSLKDGYWGKDSEAVKHRMLEED